MMDKEFKAYLDQFHPLPEADFVLFCQKMKPVAWSKGQVIVAEGETQGLLYRIRSGVQMSYSESEYKTHVVAFTYAPNFCAIPGSFLTQSPAPYTLVSLSPSEAEAISYADLQALFEQSRALERLFLRMTEAMLIGMIQRHLELHALDIETRFRVFCERSPHLLHLAPHKYIAAYLGMDATNFSKLYNRIRI